LCKTGFVSDILETRLYAAVLTQLRARMALTRKGEQKRNSS
jgi:hypothetical protein